MLIFLLKKYGKKKTVFMITISVTTLSSFASINMLYYFQGYIDNIGIFLSIIFPLVIIPIVISKFSNLLEKYELVELELVKRNADLERKLLEIKELKCLLPICKSCKKVKDDKGYWRQIESYVSKRSDIDFTHSLCNDCVKSIYPELKL